MQIHELNTFSGTPGETDFLAIDAGFDTGKISAPKLLKPATDGIAAVNERVDETNKEKVSFPLNESGEPVYGADGQLLRSKGNGTTEWADIGLPTDEQTAQAVTDWLNDHPEATTTVQDGSIGYEKLTNDMKKMFHVTPQMFYLNSDGDDWTNAFNRAIQSVSTSLSNGIGLFIFVPEGDYKISGEILLDRANVDIQLHKDAKLIFSTLTTGVRIGDKTDGFNKADNCSIRGGNLVFQYSTKEPFIVEYGGRFKLADCFIDAPYVDKAVINLGNPNKTLPENDPFGCIISNCYFNNCIGTWIDVGVDNGGAYVDEITIIENEFAGGYNGVNVKGLNNIYIGNNRFDLMESNTSGERFGIMVSFLTQGITIESNYFEARNGEMIHIDISPVINGSYAAGVSILGNTFNYEAGNVTMVKPAIRLNKIDGGVISSNIYKTGYDNSNPYGGLYLVDEPGSINAFITFANYNQVIKKSNNAVANRYMELSVDQSNGRTHFGSNVAEFTNDLRGATRFLSNKYRFLNEDNENTSPFQIGVASNNLYFYNNVGTFSTFLRVASDGAMYLQNLVALMPVSSLPVTSSINQTGRLALLRAEGSTDKLYISVKLANGAFDWKEIQLT